MEQKNKKILIGVSLVLILVLGILATSYFVLRPKTSEGIKNITVSVVDNTGAKKEYESKTDAEYLRKALEEMKGLEVQGKEGEFGLYIESVNGLIADFEKNGAYWAVYVNGEYGNYSIDKQPINDKDSYQLVYKVS